jgi:hypothetical protein
MQLKPILSIFMHHFFHEEKAGQKCGLLRQFKKLPFVKHHPTGEKSPNLVTRLVPT